MFRYLVNRSKMALFDVSDTSSNAKVVDRACPIRSSKAQSSIHGT